jgi:imidazolonepropionase-like amidohydrolase
MPRATVIDGTGKYLIPGLWDMHVHVGDEDIDKKTTLSLFIPNGVTGVRVMTGAPIHHQWRSEIEAGRAIGPRMVIASSEIDEPKTFAKEAREAIRKAKAEGADFFKVYDDLPREGYLALIEEARKQRLPVEGHVPKSMTAAEVSRLGQKSIEHLTGMSAEEMDPVKADALIAVLKKNNTWQCPTLIMRNNYAALDEPSLVNDPRLKYVKPSWRKRWTKMSADAGRQPKDYEERRHTVAREVQLVDEMHRAGVGLLAGTDDSNPYSFPGFSLHDELQMLVMSGLTPMQALQTATRNPAVFLGRLKELGTIEPGKLADLVLLDADPLVQIRNTKKINAVIKNGVLYDRKALDGMLASVEEAAK